VVAFTIHKTLLLSFHIKIAIIGGGIVGLATGLELVTRFPNVRLIVIEKEPFLAGHQTSHTSGVIHSGIYYRSGSFKARPCVERRTLALLSGTHSIFLNLWQGNRRNLGE
jgi:glycine/D-amino acid oxidase-like deaminating enzyme